MGEPDAPDATPWGGVFVRQLLTAFVLVWLAQLVFPGLKERAEPRIEESREWLGQKLEGPLAPVLDPYRILKTQERMGEAVRVLVRDRNRGRTPPSPRERGG